MKETRGGDAQVSFVVWIIGAPLYFESRAEKAEVERCDWWYTLCRDVQSDRDTLEHRLAPPLQSGSIDDAP
jgi:hypothetical protein